MEEYIILLSRVAVMNVWDELTTQSPRKLFRRERVQKARDTLYGKLENRERRGLKAV